MAKKVSWRICHLCLERFHAEDEYKLGKLFESHKVSTPDGLKCMGQAQLKLSFIRNDNAWIKRS